jgi:hypothetical protein
MKKIIGQNEGYTQLVPMVLAIVIVFALLFVGSFVNGTIKTNLVDSYPAAASRTTAQNNSIATMSNISANWDTGIDLMQVTIIITILAGAIAAIFLFTRFRGV